LFISPDQRFVTETLLDTWIDPTVERERAARVAEAALLADASPSKGPSGAAVTAVEFSDFECPFCKRAADALADMPEDIRQDVRVVFKQRPLSMHKWARRAALASVCASLQSEDAFWAVEKLLFANQEQIKADTLDGTIRGLAAGLPQLDMGRLEACLAANEGAATLVRDERLAEAYHVDVAPTIFVNGVRRTGFNGPEALWSALRLAAFDARRAAGTPPARDESSPGGRRP
jgi:protein-disulfide isomerase